MKRNLKVSSGFRNSATTIAKALFAKAREGIWEDWVFSPLPSFQKRKPDCTHVLDYSPPLPLCSLTFYPVALTLYQPTENIGRNIGQDGGRACAFRP